MQTGPEGPVTACGMTARVPPAHTPKRTSEDPGFRTKEAHRQSPVEESMRPMSHLHGMTTRSGWRVPFLPRTRYESS